MAIALFSMVGVIPKGRVRKFVNDVLFKAGFRLICRPLSAVVTFHNMQYRPRNKGFCVSNHTSPLDVAILGQDYTYSLVRHSSFKLSMCEHFHSGFKFFLAPFTYTFNNCVLFVFVCILFRGVKNHTVGWTIGGIDINLVNKKKSHTIKYSKLHFNSFFNRYFHSKYFIFFISLYIYICILFVHVLGVMGRFFG